MGFKGVILTYAAEVVVDRSTEEEVGTGAQQLKEKGSTGNEKQLTHDPAIEMWKSGVLETARMLGEGDYLALKSVHPVLLSRITDTNHASPDSRVLGQQ